MSAEDANHGWPEIARHEGSAARDGRRAAMLERGGGSTMGDDEDEREDAGGKRPGDQHGNVDAIRRRRARRDGTGIPNASGLQ